MAPEIRLDLKLVYSRTDFPKEEDLIRALQNAIDLYRSPLPGEKPSGDLFKNTRTVWRHLFHKEVNVQRRIIQPVLDERAEAYGANLPDWKKRLARLRPPTKRKRRA